MIKARYSYHKESNIVEFIVPCTYHAKGEVQGLNLVGVGLPQNGSLRPGNHQLKIPTSTGAGKFTTAKVRAKVTVEKGPGRGMSLKLQRVEIKDIGWDRQTFPCLFWVSSKTNHVLGSYGLRLRPDDEFLEKHENYRAWCSGIEKRYQVSAIRYFEDLGDNWAQVVEAAIRVADHKEVRMLKHNVRTPKKKVHSHVDPDPRAKVQNEKKASHRHPQKGRRPEKSINNPFSSLSIKEVTSNA